MSYCYFTLVKDNINLEAYNVWSGTDYLQSTMTSQKEQMPTNLHKYMSINVENCLSIKRTNIDSCNIDTTHLTNVTAGKTITYKCTIYTSDMDVAVRIRGASTIIESNCNFFHYKKIFIKKNLLFLTFKKILIFHFCHFFPFFKNYEIIDKKE